MGASSSKSGGAFKTTKDRVRQGLNRIEDYLVSTRDGKGKSGYLSARKDALLRDLDWYDQKVAQSKLQYGSRFVRQIKDDAAKLNQELGLRKGQTLTERRRAMKIALESNPPNWQVFRVNMKEFERILGGLNNKIELLPLAQIRGQLTRIINNLEIDKAQKGQLIRSLENVKTAGDVENIIDDISRRNYNDFRSQGRGGQRTRSAQPDNRRVSPAKQDRARLQREQGALREVEKNLEAFEDKLRNRTKLGLDNRNMNGIIDSIGQAKKKLRNKNPDGARQILAQTKVKLAEMQEINATPERLKRRIKDLMGQANQLKRGDVIKELKRASVTLNSSLTNMTMEQKSKMIDNIQSKLSGNSKRKERQLAARRNQPNLSRQNKPKTKWEMMHTINPNTGKTYGSAIKRLEKMTIN